MYFAGIPQAIVHQMISGRHIKLILCFTWYTPTWIHIVFNQSLVNLFMNTRELLEIRKYIDNFLQKKMSLRLKTKKND